MTVWKCLPTLKRCWAWPTFLAISVARKGFCVRRWISSWIRPKASSVAAARDETGQFRKPGHSRLRATARDCVRAQLINVLFEPSGLSSEGGTSVLADVLDQLQPSSATPLTLDGQSMERDASRRLLEGAINRYINPCDATQTLATVLDIVGNHTFDYSQLIDTADEAEVTLDFEWT